MLRKIEFDERLERARMILSESIEILNLIEDYFEEGRGDRSARAVLYTVINYCDEASGLVEAFSQDPFDEEFSVEYINKIVRKSRKSGSEVFELLASGNDVNGIEYE